MTLKQLTFAAAAALLTLGSLAPAHAAVGGKPSEKVKKILAGELASDAHTIKPTAEQQANRDKLEQIRLAEVDLKDVTVPDCLDFLRGEARKASILINFVYDMPRGHEVETIPLLKAQDINGLEFLKLLKKEAKAKYRIDDNAVVVHPDVPGIEKFFRRQWMLSPLVVELAFDEYQAAVSDATRQDMSDALIAFFKSYGVEFPEGSSLSYNAQLSLLTVMNTGDNMDTLNNALLKKGKDMLKKAKDNKKEEKKRQRSRR